MNKPLQQKEIVLNNEQETKYLAKKLASLDINGSVWLSGDLGAGKTTLTRYWLNELGYEGSVKSPTYTLVEPYSITQHTVSGQPIIKPIYHADLYRLQDFEELEFIGFNEYLEEPSALLIIEWASRALDYLPVPVLKIDICTCDDDSRQIIISSNCNNIDIGCL